MTPKKCSWNGCTADATHEAYQWSVKTKKRRYVCGTHLVDDMRATQRLMIRGMVWDRLAS